MAILMVGFYMKKDTILKRLKKQSEVLDVKGEGAIERYECVMLSTDDKVYHIPLRYYD
jgi:hypothetical protein